VIQLLQNPELAEQLAANAQQEFRRYTWPIVREQWLEVYRGMINR
jgi:glycosyltransferase involved in cell wall biosynthesis